MLKVDVPSSFCRNDCNAGKFFDIKGCSGSGGEYCPNPAQSSVTGIPATGSKPDWEQIAQERRDAKEAKRIKKAAGNS